MKKMLQIDSESDLFDVIADSDEFGKTIDVEFAGSMPEFLALLDQVDDDYRTEVVATPDGDISYYVAPRNPLALEADGFSPWALLVHPQALEAANNERTQ